MLLQIFIACTVVSLARGAEVCCQPSGDCYTDDPPFEGANWPLPECHQPTFELWRKDMTGSREITRGNTPSEYDPNDDTVYLLHGWTSDGTQWPEDAKDEFLKSSKTYNVIVVDWEEGASPAYYPQAASNVRVTGSEIADINEQLNPRFSWCAGHSLGAHSCGHAGKAGANLDRITGMDPAGPNFDLEECSADAQTCRLHPSDANQVDTIHTDATVSGTFSEVGSIAFYPNGGVGIQPGCDSYACGHSISYAYFMESINTDCFVATHHECGDNRDLPGSCNTCGVNDCPNMGASTSFGSGIYYLETNSRQPYCQG